MKKQMLLATLCLGAGSVAVFTGCQTKAEYAAMNQRQQAAEMTLTEAELTEADIASDPVVVSQPEAAPEASSPGVTQVTEPTSETAPAQPEAAPAPAPAPAAQKPVQQAPKWAVYTVTAGDSVSALSKRFGVREPDILALNPALRKNKNNLRIGQKLNFPAGTDVTVAPKPKKPAPVAKQGAVLYTVKAGDVLGGIAIKHGVTAASIREANGIKGDMIRVGQKLQIPGGKAVATKAPAKKEVKKAAPAPKKDEPKKEEAKPVEVTPVTPTVEPVDVPPAPPAGPEVEDTPPVVENPDQPAPPPVVVEPTESNTKTHVVAEDEDLVIIALRWGLTLPALCEANGLDPNTKSVAPGTTLKIPVAE